MTSRLVDASRINGCLLGGAVGDAFGAPIEFYKLAQIRAEFGPDGLREFAPAYGRLGAITDDTQMTLFTVEGIIRAYVRACDRGVCDPSSVVHHAYLRWARTQDVRLNDKFLSDREFMDGWLVKAEGIKAIRAPGNTCLTALGEATAFGQDAKNDSKGCGTVMRVAPVGLMWAGHDLGEGNLLAFRTGVEVSRFTHGHPTGYLAGGYFAQLIALLMTGRDLRSAAIEALAPLRDQENAGEVQAAVQGAVELFDTGVPPTPEAVESLGGGWVAEEAVAISLYCALAAESFEHGIRLAANISGDSDSTASMTGQLLGVIGGKKAVPRRWLQKLELRNVIEQLARDLALTRSGELCLDKERLVYPGW